MNEPIDKKLVMAITNAFNDALRDLILSTHGIMPDDAIVLNVISALCVARKELGFSNEDTHDAIVRSLNQNMAWAADFDFGGET